MSLLEMKERHKNPDSTRFVVRIDSESTHGYQVRLPIKGKQVSKFFSDGVYGGKRASKKEALEYRDKRCKSLKIPMNNLRIIHRRDSRNSSGHVGVSILWRTVGDYQHKYYVASWTPKPGHPQKRKSFSATKYGDKKALQMAINYRKKMEKDILGLGKGK